MQDKIEQEQQGAEQLEPVLFRSVDDRPCGVCDRMHVGLYVCRFGCAHWVTEYATAMRLHEDGSHPAEVIAVLRAFVSDVQAQKKHRIQWWVYAGRERIRHTAKMRGQWGYDATCSCGWDSKTGGGVRRWVEEKVWNHKHGLD